MISGFRRQPFDPDFFCVKGGSPIPSLQEGAWVREDPKVVGGGLMQSL